MNPPQIIRQLGLLVASTCAALGAAQTPGPGVFPSPERIKYDSALFQIEGRDVFLYGGSFHYFRVPRELWRDRFEKIKAAGFNMVETYVPWNYHEPAAPAGPGDYSKLDLTELQEWMRMAEDFGFYIIIRPGPYICAEWAGGGYPRWLLPLFKPAGWPADKVWLQTDDPAYLAWNKHWYDAVTRVVAPHQITRKAPGSPGVIMFQIENEYERLKWVPGDVKTRHLAALARQTREGGIDVPIVTCWTRQTRNSNHPDLRGVFDFINSYPKWEIGKKFRETMEKQRKEQPYAPVATMELQGGWYSEIGGRLSEQIDGIAPVQTQNLTLYCLQLGYGLINYYMLVGGTNFDDWASREATATYDFAAAIREHGGVGERYQRVAGIGALLREHGVRITRADTLAAVVECPDPAVQVAVRRAADGTRYVFVRTEDRSAPRSGRARVTEPDGTRYAFDFALEPFGSELLVLPPGVTDAARGEWLPKRAPLPARPDSAALPAAIKLETVLYRADPLPDTWEKLAPGDTLEAKGVLHTHPLYYRVTAPAGAEITVGRLGPNVIKKTLADVVVARSGDKLLQPLASDSESITYRLPADQTRAVLLYSDTGHHHHTTVELEREWNTGLRGVRSGGRELPIEFASVERQRGPLLSRPETPAAQGWTPLKIGPAAESSKRDALLAWYRFEVELPSPPAETWVPWHLKLHAEGNGYIYLNGRALGRYWEAGPQNDFFLPDSWLHLGPGKKNVIIIGLHPSAAGVGITEAAIIPAVEFAEKR